ncbi:hypothetical protein CGLO_05652 [Colletotrichum gloeosporioides Cg-14]|uniref:NADP-dependent oxidoreductase domain-containing protein n=1 Tax=Colletotrichum gloeosporioides (strain Cg-14) TaxID=1237896 RepID=T0LS19_COLGC|nr:hypothetical protein CGLO_05652 [Colletotrichum gloeosporioides Cg-14]
MSFPQLFTLNDGHKVPADGFGTFQGTNGNFKVKDTVERALMLGYRHIDGVNVYGNEKSIGKDIKDIKVPREEISVTSRLWAIYAEYAVSRSPDEIITEYIIPAQTWHESAHV